MSFNISSIESLCLQESVHLKLHWSLNCVQTHVLRHLRLQKCFDKGLCDLRSNYMGLTALNISGIENIESVFFSVECAEKTSIPRSGTFMYLRKLNISIELWKYSCGTYELIRPYPPLIFWLLTQVSNNFLLTIWKETLDKFHAIVKTSKYFSQISVVHPRFNEDPPKIIYADSTFYRCEAQQWACFTSKCTVFTIIRKNLDKLPKSSVQKWIFVFLACEIVTERYIE